MAEDSPILRMTSEDLARSAANSASVQTSSPSITGCFTPLPTAKKKHNNSNVSTQQCCER